MVISGDNYDLENECTCYEEGADNCPLHSRKEGKMKEDPKEKGEKIVFVLKEHNGEFQGWQEIKEEELKKWLEDGSISKGDMIVYPKKILIAEEELKLKLRKRRRNEYGKEI